MKDTHYTISGTLVKIAFAHEVELFLNHDSPKRPAARFNRQGENALYLSVNEESARVAMRKYANPSDAPRVLIRYEVQTCKLFDLRHADASALRKLASHDWKAELEKGIEPSSWQVADKLRKDNEVGLVDPSRKNPDLWHVTLLRWNQAGAPEVSILGEPSELVILP